MKLTLLHGGKEVPLEYGQPVRLSQAVRESGFSLAMPCNGNGKCGKCRVQVEGACSPLQEEEQRLLGERAGEGWRLACLAFAEGDCVVRIPEQGETSIVSDGYLPAFEKNPIGSRYGFAVDIGTTTVVVYCYDLQTCGLAGKATFPNPQSPYGADVISRIQSSLDGKGQQLREKIVFALEQAFLDLCRQEGIPRDAVDAMVITGNTTMLYLLCGRDVEPLSHAPFQIREFYGRDAGDELRFTAFPQARVYLPRCISAFVGADITCSILSSDIVRQPGASLMVDIGTNGEMALYHDGNLYCCSTAAGPAFEGAKISHGCPAVRGAVNKVWAENGALRYETIGGAPAIGLCGTGLIDAVAAFVKTGLIDETGRIDDEAENGFAGLVTEYDGQPAVRIGDSGVLVTQPDLRAVQLAKAAICAGIHSLIHEAGLQEEDIGHLYLAGGFGSFIDRQSAGDMGLIPPRFVPVTKVLGNAAGMGATMILQSAEKRAESAALAKRAGYVELSTSPFFMEQYVACMMFES